MKRVRKSTTAKSVPAPATFRRPRRVVSISLSPELLDRIERHAESRSDIAFSRAVGELITVGLGACAEPVHDADSTSLLALILDRLEERGGELPYDSKLGLWRAKCPINPEHDLFVRAYTDDPQSSDCTSIGFLDTHHSAEALCIALGLKVHSLDPAAVFGYVDDVPVLRPSKSEGPGKENRGPADGIPSSDSNRVESHVNCTANPRPRES